MFTNKISRKTVAGFAVELVIVFVGVYLAFVFADYQEELQDRAIRVKYYNSLILEFTRLDQHLEQENEGIQRHLVVVAEIEEGGRPELTVSDLSYLYRGSVVAAAFNSENFESLDPDILSAIISGIPLLEYLEDRVDRFNDLTATVLLPMKAAGAPEYNADGSLRAHLAWYPRLLREIGSANRALHEIVNDLAIPDLAESRDELLARRFHWPF